jgi:hypothetical protein
MKWAFYIFDPKNLFTDQYKSKLWKSAYAINAGTYPKLLELVIDTYKNFDHFALIYDGNWIFDGPANMAFYTLRYNGGPNKLMNHHTNQLIDVVLQTPYEKESIQQLVDEINANFVKFS